MLRTESDPAIAADPSLETGLLASTVLAVVRLDAHGRSLAWSPAAARSLGVPPVIEGDRVRLPDGGLLSVELHPLEDGALAVVPAAAVSAVAELRARFDHSPLPEARVGLDGRILEVNAAMETLLGFPQDLLRGRDGLRMFDQADREPAAAALERLLHGDRSRAVQEGTVRRADGSPVRVQVHAAVVRDGVGAPLLVCSVQDLTGLRTAERAVDAGEARLRALLRHATDVVVVIDARGRMTYVSPAVADRFGYDERALHGTSALALNHPDDVDRIREVFAQVQTEPGSVRVFECRVRHADGSWRWTEQRYTNLLGDPDVGGMVVNMRETTERRRAEQELRRLALRDGLTGLANRTLLLDRVTQAMARSARSGEQAGLVLLDVEGMRAHNESLGHEGGDALLVAVAERLRAAVELTDTVARIGPDEFAVLVEGVGTAERLRARTTALLAVAEEPMSLAGRAVQVRLRTGSALTPADGAGALLAVAERALRTGRSDRLLLRATRTDVRKDRDELTRAIAGGQLRLHFQPVLLLATGEVEGVEALVRWEHPARGLLAPADFIPLAEATGLVVELGEWVLRTACTAVAAWPGNLSVGVNLAPGQLAVPGFGVVLRSVLADTGLAPGRLVLEVTESALVDDDGALATLRGLHRLGVRLALDDFGTGYSSLTYLKRFPVDAIKVDRSFVAGLGRDRDDDAIVASVVSLARSIGKTVVAEGVETGCQLAALRALGVEQAQGFLWSPALPEAELRAWLGQHAPAGALQPALLLEAPVQARHLDRVHRRILELHADGASLQTIAAALNAAGERSPTGRAWHSRSVARVVAALVTPI